MNEYTRTNILQQGDVWHQRSALQDAMQRHRLQRWKRSAAENNMKLLKRAIEKAMERLQQHQQEKAAAQQMDTNTCGTVLLFCTMQSAS